jgi:DnaJ-class molecular chaperone
MSTNYYDTLGIHKTASESEIKKAYKKKALEYHPDRNKWDKSAEMKFKEVNEAYQTLSDKTKKQNYDQFGSAEANPFWWMGGSNPFGNGGGYYGSTWNTGGFEDIFSQFWGWGSTSGFDFGDIFGSWSSRSWRKEWRNEETKKEIPNLDVTETMEIPFFDFLYDTSLSIKTVYGKVLSLKIKAGTKPGTRFKISGKWRTIDGKTGDMYVIVDAKMPKTPLDPTVEKMIEAIRYQI